MKIYKSFKDKVIPSVQQYTRTDVRYIVRGGSWLLLNQAVNILLGLVLAIAFANLLYKSEYGTYKYITSIVGILGSFAISVLSPTAIIQSVSRGYEGLVRYAFRANFLWSIPMILVSAGASLYYFLHDNMLLSAALAIIAVFQPIAGSAAVFGPYLNGKKEFHLFAASQFVRNAVPSILLLISLFLTNNVLLIVLVNLASSALVTYGIYRYVLAKHPPNDRVDDASFSYGRHIGFMSVISSVVNRIDALFIFHFLGATPVAIYSFATAIPEQFFALLKNVQTLALPRFSEGSKEDIKRNLFRKNLILFLFAVFCGALYALIAPFLFSIFFPQYMEAVPFTRLFVLTLPLAALALLPATLLDAELEAKKKYGLVIFSQSLRLILLYALIVPYGITGVILSEIFTRAAYLVALFFVIKKL